MIFYAVCKQLKVNENILQSFKSESTPCIKLLSLKRVVFKTNSKPFHVDVNIKH